MASAPQHAEVAVIGAGIVGLAVAYYVARRHGVRDVVVIDPGDPMALTSAQSGENYRNWWPHPVMRSFTDLSTTLMEEIARATGNRIRMTRRGYVLVTRDPEPSALIAELHAGYGADAASSIRIHRGESGTAYRPADSEAWEDAPGGVDVLLDRGMIQHAFPHLAPDVASILHIRRAGDVSGQQLGMHMLESLRDAGGRLMRARVTGIEPGSPFRLQLEHPGGEMIELSARILVNAAGPFIGEIAAMLGETLPVQNVLQQKIAFEDRERIVPRTMPFTIDLDGQRIAWTEEERELLAADPATAALTEPMPGGIHCRPEGGEHGSWIKLGWAFNARSSEPTLEPGLSPHFPDIVLRGASRLHPRLATYLGRLPRGTTHYGGFYTMTPENWPLIGAMRTPGAYVAGALSGFGTMAACATGALVADRIAGAALPDFAPRVSPDRYDDASVMAEIRAQQSKGVL